MFGEYLSFKVSQMQNTLGMGQQGATQSTQAGKFSHDRAKRQNNITSGGCFPSCRPPLAYARDTSARAHLAFAHVRRPAGLVNSQAKASHFKGNANVNIVVLMHKHNFCIQCRLQGISLVSANWGLPSCSCHGASSVTDQPA